MLWARRILSACLALTLAGFSVAAAAPGHSHGVDGNHHDILHVMAVDAHGDIDHAHSHDAGSTQDLQLSDQGDDRGNGDDQTEGAPVFHSHSFASYTAVEGCLSLDRQIEFTTVSWCEPACARVTGSCSPLLRPPRLFL